MRAGILISVAAVLLSGCVAVQLERVQPYTPGASSSRDASSLDVLGPDDDIELRLEQNGVARPITVRFENALELVHGLPYARLTYGLLRDLGSIQVKSASGAEMPVTTSASRWSELARTIEAVQVDCGGAPCQLLAERLPKTTHRPAPGERLQLDRSWVDASPTNPTALISTDSRIVTVDPEGWINVPLLGVVEFSSIAASGEEHQDLDLGVIGMPGFRRTGAEIEEAHSRLRVYWDGADRPTLADAGACLAVANFPPEPAKCHPDNDTLFSAFALKPELIARCRKIGVGPQFRVCPNIASSVHYRFTAPPAVWTLVSERGLRLVVPYRRGMTVSAAATEAYPLLVGRELTSWGFSRHAYLTVIGDPVAGERFWIRIRRGAPMANEPLLQPGDTVLVNRSKPLQLRPVRGAR